VTKTKRQKSRDSRHVFPKKLPKVLFYDALAALNRDFEQVLRDLERLEELRLFRHRWQREFLKVWRATLEETRAWVSFEVLEVLHQKEEREWARFGHMPQRAEEPSESAVLVPIKGREAKSPRRG
jgi:hypothetical protein